jgi:hypothetical protein
MNLFDNDIEISFLSCITKLQQLYKKLNLPNNTNEFVNDLTLYMYYSNYLSNYLKIISLTTDKNVSRYKNQATMYLDQLYNDNIYHLINQNKTDDIKVLKLYEYITNKIVDNKNKKNINQKIAEFISNINKLEPNNYNNNITKYKKQADRIEYDKNFNTDIILNKFVDIVNLKINYGRTYDKTYFNYKKNITDESLHNYIETFNNIFINNFNESVEKNIKLIKSKLNITDVHMVDIIYYLMDKYTVKNLNVMPNIDLIIKLIKHYFNISFDEIKYEYKLWNDNIKTYIIKYNKKSLGYLHLDLSYSTEKKMKIPIYTVLNKECNNINTKTHVAIIGNYRFNDLITYDDVVHLFKLFGNVIKDVAYDNNENDEMDNLFITIFEYIALNVRETITDNSNSVLTNVLVLKIKCINQLFDYIIHNNTNEYNIESMKTTYFTLADEILKGVMHNETINTITLSQLCINDCNQYMYLVNKIIGYNIAITILNNKDCGHKLIKEIYQKKTHDLKYNLSAFIDTYCLSSSEAITSYIDFINKNN